MRTSLSWGQALCGFVDPGEHGFAGDGAKDLTGEAGRGEAGGDDTEDGGWALFAVPRNQV